MPGRCAPTSSAAASSRRFVTPSFVYARCRWLFTVRTERYSFAAISGLLTPAAASVQISRSRAVKRHRCVGRDEGRRPGRLAGVDQCRRRGRAWRPRLRWSRSRWKRVRRLRGCLRGEEPVRRSVRSGRSRRRGRSPDRRRARPRALPMPRTASPSHNSASVARAERSCLDGRAGRHRAAATPPWPRCPLASAASAPCEQQARCTWQRTSWRPRSTRDRAPARPGR